MENDVIELVVFDFDGTLCDSADVKTTAFYDLYRDEFGPAFAADVREYHLANAGISRYDKIRHIERTFIGREPSDARVEEVASKFSRLVEQAVIDAPLFDGVHEFLATPPANILVTVASATPTDELRRITDGKALSDLFHAIEGSPRSKAEIISGYISTFDVAPGRTVMVGDQPSDLAGAQGAGVRALMIAPPDAAWVGDAARAADFAEAATWLTSRMETID